MWAALVAVGFWEACEVRDGPGGDLVLLVLVSSILDLGSWILGIWSYLVPRFSCCCWFGLGFGPGFDLFAVLRVFFVCSSCVLRVSFFFLFF
jgi:hypothetical protein